MNSFVIKNVWDGFTEYISEGTFVFENEIYHNTTDLISEAKEFDSFEDAYETYKNIERRCINISDNYEIVELLQ